MRKIVLILLLVTMVLRSFAQDIRKEVYIVKPFKPIISDFEKISIFPQIDDTIQVKPVLQYNVIPSGVETEFNIRPIQPATMSGIAQNKLYLNYIKAGFGNYSSPLLEFGIQNDRSRDLLLGANFNHLSSSSKLTLENDHKVPAANSTNNFNAYVKKIFNQNVIKGELQVNKDKVHAYGYNIDSFAILPVISRKEIRRKFTNVQFTAGLHSIYTESDDMNYNLLLQLGYFRHNTIYIENSVNVSGDIHKNIKGFDIEIGSRYFHHTYSEAYDTSSNNIFTICGLFGKNYQKWRFKTGIHIATEIDEETNTYIYPKIYLQYNIINDEIIPFIELDGYLEDNSNRSIANRNKFIKTGIIPKNSNHRFILKGGFFGKIAQKSGYTIYASFAEIDDLPLFINDTSTLMANYFEIVYDKVEIINLHGSIDYLILSDLNVLLIFDMYKHQMTNEQEPWHRPNTEITLNLNYNIRDKIIFDVNLYHIGKRYALRANNNTDVLDSYIDLSLGIEYKYSRGISAFINGYNLTSRQQYKWNFYPSRKLFILGGLSFQF